MDTCVIFCAGGFDRLAEPLDGTDLVIAADGGWKHTCALGVKPGLVLGDFDSLGYVPESGQVYPVEKDDTDAMLAVRRGLERGYRRFVLYGGLDGPRLDHTLANLQVLRFLRDHGARGYLVGLRYLAALIGEETVTFPPEAGGILSLFCLGEDARGVTLKGLQYPLDRGTITSGFPLGVSNHFIGQKAVITVEQGVLTALYDRTNGFPQTEKEQL